MGGGGVARGIRPIVSAPNPMELPNYCSILCNILHVKEIEIDNMT